MHRYLKNEERIQTVDDSPRGWMLSMSDKETHHNLCAGQRKGAAGLICLVLMRNTIPRAHVETKPTQMHVQSEIRA